MGFKVPILFITFNRPETSKKVLEAICKINPEKVYLFSDGPRANNDSDRRKVDEVRRALTEAHWNGEVLTNFQTKNHGGGKGGLSAINWAFENEDHLIIIEDDCVPDNSFFLFCEMMLNKYNYDSRVMHISGSRWNPEFITKESYLFSSISHIWGWATWKRAWDKYDYEMSEWKKYAANIRESLKDYFSILFWKGLFKSIANSNEKHAWDYQWQYTLFKEKGLSIIPDVNLISNIGLEGAHSNAKNEVPKIQEYIYNRKTIQWNFNKDPIEIKQNLNYDRYHMKNHFLKYQTLFDRCKVALKYYLINE